jgi:O-methyltransferase
MFETLSIRDLLTLAGRPKLATVVRRARKAGLETLIDYQRLATLWAAARLCRDVPGDAIECGVYRGGSAALIAEGLQGTAKTLHLCDSFQGLPAPTEQDNFHKAHDFADASPDAIRTGLEALGLVATIHVGWFATTLPRLAERRFALAHVDADLYESVRECLLFCHPRMSAGGVMVFDDYASPTCEGARAAVDEFFSAQPEKPEVLSWPQAGVWRLTPDRSLRRTVLVQALWFGRVTPVSSRILRILPR